MGLYLIIGIVLIVGIIIRNNYKTLVNLQDEATMLLAYVKHAGQRKSAFSDPDKSDEEFYKEMFKRVQDACFLMIRFSEKVHGKRNDYRFRIRENGSMFGVDVVVNVEQFMTTIKTLLTDIINVMPEVYQKQLKDYLNQPYSPINEQLSKEIEARIWPKDPCLEYWASRLRENILEQDHLFTIFK